MTKTLAEKIGDAQIAQFDIVKEKLSADERLAQELDTEIEEVLSYEPPVVEQDKLDIPSFLRRTKTSDRVRTAVNKQVKHGEKIMFLTDKSLASIAEAVMIKVCEEFDDAGICFTSKASLELKEGLRTLVSNCLVEGVYSPDGDHKYEMKKEGKTNAND